MTNTFRDDSSYKNIELGAGCGNFGNKFYPKCYITDNDETLKSNCINCYVDFFCDAYKLPWGDNRFEKVILCNPFGYGFDDEDDSIKLLNELIRVSKNNCEITIICNERNKYCTPKRVIKRISKYETLYSVSLPYNEESIDSQRDYVDHSFKCSDGSETKPNKRMKIYVKK